MPNKPYKGNPSFPNSNPDRLDAGDSSNDTQLYYMLDPDGQTVTLGNVQDEDGNTDSALSGQTINTPKYGRFKRINVDEGSAAPLYIYPWVDASGTN